ncbi:hypothetical protein KDA_67700 [Dictyobacter alpinus]|uniref:Polyketide synthase n=1 Tax=Dictyobacter alpinus TaxID=2014873 RepID=A0A402BIX2_9CHLR|nr:type I polyketide synthase [Dictyobacter alpinus]GCE31286.1 hypothetical protein KDA_67700 [Dictyobacter alpinus]
MNEELLTPQGHMTPSVANQAGDRKSEHAIQAWLSEHLAEILQIAPEQIRSDEPFASYGLESVDAVGLSGDLEDWLGCELSPTLLYDHPSVRKLARALSRSVDDVSEAEQHRDVAPDESIAVIGIGCRFPGGVTNPDAFWQFLRDGGNGITEVPASRWDVDAYYDADPDAPGKMYTRHGGFLADSSRFDAEFFGISPREAMRMDPQQRLLYEVTWEALEHASIPSESLTGSQTGVFIGMMNNLEYLQLQSQTGEPDYIDDPYWSIGSSSSMAAGRLAYLYDWHGPGLTVDTACSSSLVSLHLACQSLRNQECSLAVVGGVNAIVLPETMVNACKMGMLSPNGQCSTFDEAADGFALGEGCGVVIVKRLSDAMADHNHILAVIRGSAVNQDGRSNGITAPNKLAQEAVIRSALANAHISPEQVDYVETHGSGTALGDPIEISALASVLGTGHSQERPLLVGTVKTNIGHLAGAAGIAGLIKTILSLTQREIPPHLHLQKPNAHIPWQSIPVHVPDQPTAWPKAAGARIAGVSSFGWSGTNAHVILEEAPTLAEQSHVASKQAPSAQLLVLSAKTNAALQRTSAQLATYLKQHPQVDLAAVAATLQQGRSVLNVRRIVVSQDRDEAIKHLETWEPAQMQTSVQQDSRPAVAFLFPGVGEQYIGMARQLYQQETYFRTLIDQCCELLQPLLGQDLRDLLFADTAVDIISGSMDLRAMRDRQPQQTNPLAETSVAQPVVFVLEYALARLWQHWGIEPQALLGYSLGEYVAACLAGVFSLEDALLLTARRAQLIARQPAGAMLAVGLSEQEVQRYLTTEINLAIINAPMTCVLAGPVEAIARLQVQLEHDEVIARRIETTHAFHSRMLEPVRAELESLLAGMQLHAPQIPLLSNVTGSWLTEEQATDASYWGRHMCETVRFADGVGVLLQEPEQVLLEVGVGQSLGSFVRQHALCSRDQMQRVIATLPGRFERQSEQSYLLTMLGKLWLAGVPLDWQSYYADQPQPWVALPTYPFEQTHYWITAARPAAQQQRHPLTGQPKKVPQIDDWFYQPTWKEVALPGTNKTLNFSAPVLAFMDDADLLEQLRPGCERNGQPFICVRRGQQFTQIDEHHFVLRPAEAGDYQRLWQCLNEQQLQPQTILHGWSITSTADEASGQAFFRAMQECGLYSLLFLTRALSTRATSQIRIHVITNHSQACQEQEVVYPEKATLQAACQVISQENPQISCRLIDLAYDPVAAQAALPGAEQLLAECMTATNDLLVAYRAGQRLVRTYQQVQLHEALADNLPLRQQGVYLITGGLGAVGLVVASHLAILAQARLVFTTRSPFPEQSDWTRWLEEHSADDTISRKIQQLQALQQCGSQILIVQADSADEQQMRVAIQHIQQHFGTLHGVIHAAGNTHAEAFKSTLDIGPVECEQHFQAKVYGLYVLEQVLQGQNLDFCLLFSSISAVLGGLGFVGYAAANSFIDAFTYSHNRRTTGAWTCVNWDTWHVGSDKEQSQALSGSAAEYAMTAQEGCEAVIRVLAQTRYRHLVNSTGDLQARQQQWSIFEEDSEDVATVTLAPRTAASKFGRQGPAEFTARSEYERAIADIWQDALGLEKVGLYDNFFDLGGNSLIGMQVVARLKKVFQQPLSAMSLFEAPTISAMVQHLLPQSIADQPVDQQQRLAMRRQEAQKSTGTGDIAIIGMSGRFPGASNVEEFWENLRNGVESIAHFSDEELLAAGVDASQLAQENYIKARPILKPEEIENFDAAFFGYSPREAELTDPQHRLFLECAWEALEMAGYDTSTYQGLIGVYGGNNLSMYMTVLSQANALQEMDDYQMVIGHDKDSLTTNVSYKLNLRGPSFAVQTFCSTSLVATHLACRSLLNGECDIALAGGVSLRIPSKIGYSYHEGGMESPDGHCRTFDADARGSLFGDGVALVALKRLDHALTDGDTIHAVIKGSAINNDGSLKVSYTAPSIVGQAEVVASALQVAQIDPASISYVEAHGTATELGDPIELSSLTRAYRAYTQKNGYCAIGSVKTNIGHLDRAAGVTGLIKTVMALKHKELPASLHYKAPNPEIDFATSPFYVNTQLTPWISKDGPRRAGVNSLGMGGTNAHVIVEEAPERQPGSAAQPWQLLLLSARTASALDVATENLCRYLQQHPQANLADVAYTLQLGRRKFAHRRLIVCRNTEEAIQALQKPQSSHVLSAQEPRTDRRVAFLFPGVGEQYIGMARQLYQQETYFRTLIDQCCELLQPLLGQDLRDLLFADATDDVTSGSIDLSAMRDRQQQPAQPQPLAETTVAQPVVFVLEYALARLWQHWGIEPQALLGYSLGEYVAACLAGVFSLEDALLLTARRAQLIARQPAGAMLAVGLSEQAVQPYLTDEINLAIINAPMTCVLAGPVEAIARLQVQLEHDEVIARRVETTHAFHSRMLEPVRAELESLLAGMQLHAPQIPLLSNVTGSWLTEEQATDASYWGRHMCETVRFADGVGVLLQEPEQVLLEVGVGQSLGSFVRQHALCSREQMQRVMPTLPGRFERQAEQSYLLTMLGKLWLAGVPLDWQNFYAQQVRYRIPLPTYPFERQRYFIDAPQGLQRGPAMSQPEQQKKADIADWFYQPVWKQATFQHTATSIAAPFHWLVFANDDQVSTALLQGLARSEQRVVVVKSGNVFEQVADHSYRINPAARADYTTLLRTLREAETIPTRIISLWPMAHPDQAERTVLERSFYHLLSLAQALGDIQIDGCRISVITENLYDVLGDEYAPAEQATVTGLCKVIPQEYTNLQCQQIDLAASITQQQMDTLLQELVSTSNEPQVALRGRHRWIPVYEPCRLEQQGTHTTLLRDRGTYLLTGGLGGVGLAMANYLARSVQARLVLVSRTGLPPRDQWQRIIAEQGDHAGTGRQIRQVLQLEELGSEVLILAADVADEAQMRQVIARTQATFGGLHGVLNVAGLPGVGLIQLKTEQAAGQVLAPKVQGTRVLERVLQEHPLDFLILFSSITAVTGGPGQVDYCAANAFLDSYAHHQRTPHTLVASIAWSEWQWNAWEAGLEGFDEATKSFFRENRARFGISFAEGAKVLRRVLSHRQTQVIVSPQNFQALIELSRTMTLASMIPDNQKSRQAPVKHDRPALGNTYVAPRNATETRIASIWEDLLGITDVGIHDNFFDLGGNSLVGLELINRLRKAFLQETLPSYVLYEAPSVSAMATYLDQEKESVTAAELNERSDKRRVNLKKRMSGRVK